MKNPKQIVHWLIAVKVIRPFFEFHACTEAEQGYSVANIYD
jgi:hypothetical protein